MTLDELANRLNDLVAALASIAGELELIRKALEFGFDKAPSG